ncbi:MAG: O-antigen ligase family protein [Rikenellaceae bacterium]|nr:O-antigen ligase family protein [Rikenellaceae bacterium]
MILIIYASAILLSKSRGGYIALVGSLLFLYFPQISRYIKRIPKVFKTVIKLIIVVSFLGFLVALVRMDTMASKGRLYIWEISGLMIKDNMFSGVDVFQTSYFEYQGQYLEKKPEYIDFSSTIRQAHNQYIHYFAEKGVIGLFLFLTVIYIAVIPYFKDSNKNFLPGIYIGSSILAVLIHSFFDSPLYFFTTKIYFWMLISVISTVYYKSILSISLKKGNNFLRLPLSVLIAGIGIYFLSINANHITAYYEWIKGKKQFNSYNFDKTTKHLANAEKSLKNNGKLYFDLGLVSLMTGKYEDAIDYFDKSSIFFSDKDILYFTAKAHERLNNKEEGIMYYKKLIYVYPALLKPRLELSKLYTEIKDFREAEHLLLYVLNAQPKIYNLEIESIQLEAAELLETLIKNEQI